MKITRSQLKSLIKEEMDRMLEFNPAKLTATVAAKSAVAQDEPRGQATANPEGPERTGMVNLDAMDERDLMAAVQLISYNSITKDSVPQELGKPWGQGKKGANYLTRAIAHMAVANRTSDERPATLEIDWLLKAGEGVPTLSIEAVRATQSTNQHPDVPEGKLQKMAEEFMASVNAANLPAQHAGGTVSLSVDQPFTTKYDLS
tara:strand:+ start:1830 stop:2438 length:609 start_codon:yes stop_codon:yes gene_type:complete